jgi:hypothetical protein
MLVPTGQRRCDLTQWSMSSHDRRQLPTSYDRRVVISIEVDVVVPSAASTSVLERTLHALARAIRGAPRLSMNVVLVDDRPERTGVPDLASDSDALHLATEGGVGSGGARNVGAEVGSAPWIVFLDDDVELSAGSLTQLDSILRESPAVAVVGGLRPPPGAPPWLIRSYADGVLTAASAYLPDGPVSPTQLSSGLVAIRREAFEAVGGFPKLPVWGWVDPLLGLRLQVGRSDAAIHRDTRLAGIHWHLPSWTQYLDRLEEAGRRLRVLLPSLTVYEREELLASVVLDDSWRARVKSALGVLPPGLLVGARGRLPRKAAAAAALARGYRQAVPT